MHPLTPTGASHQVTGQGSLIQSWFQIPFQGFPGHRPIFGITLLAGAEAGEGAGAQILLLLTPPAGSQGLQLEQDLGAKPEPALWEFLKQE